MTSFYKIPEALKNYSHNSEVSISETLFSNQELMLTWTINEFCNFKCLYCGQYDKENPATGTYSVEHIQNCFDATGKIWHIIITGGEPFLYPDFVKLISALTKNHYVSINTNLSAANVPDFIETIDPKKVIMINAGAHLHEREKNESAKNNYISRFLQLQEKGFNIVASYVVHPEFIGRMENDFSMLKEKGFKLICAKTFSGTYNNKSYPDAYTEQENILINKYSDGSIELPAYRIYTNFKNRICLTGNKFFAMDPAGNMCRCLSDNSKFGNFFEGTFKPGSEEQNCNTINCVCPYQGMIYSKNKIIKTSFMGYVKKIFNS